jgi:hypothetical protein
MKGRSITLFLAILTIVALLLSAPTSLRQAYDRGGFYVFSHEFFADLPKRLAGPGKFRFIIQPLIAIIIGARMGFADRRQGRPPYLSGLLFASGQRRELIASAWRSVANLVLMGILLDSIFQWVLLGSSYPGAALVVGPVLIMTPYALARALAHRFASLQRSS